MTETRKQLKNRPAFYGPAKDRLIAALENCGPIRVNLGCGNDYLEGWCNIDYGHHSHCDLSINLDDHMLRLPWDDGKVDAIYASHILEHINKLQQLKREIARVLRPDGKMIVVVPAFNSPDAWGDDTHCRAFSIHSFLKDYWPGMTPMSVEEIDGVKDVFGNKLTWLLAHIKGGE